MEPCESDGCCSGVASPCKDHIGVSLGIRVKIVNSNVVLAAGEGEQTMGGEEVERKDEAWGRGRMI
jgi:hypothetical protein